MDREPQDEKLHGEENSNQEKRTSDPSGQQGIQALTGLSGEYSQGHTLPFHQNRNPVVEQAEDDSVQQQEKIQHTPISSINSSAGETSNSEKMLREPDPCEKMVKAQQIELKDGSEQPKQKLIPLGMSKGMTNHQRNRDFKTDHISKTFLQNSACNTKGSVGQMEPYKDILNETKPFSSALQQDHQDRHQQSGIKDFPICSQGQESMNMKNQEASPNFQPNLGRTESGDNVMEKKDYHDSKQLQIEGKLEKTFSLEEINEQMGGSIVISSKCQDEKDNNTEELQQKTQEVVRLENQLGSAIQQITKLNLDLSKQKEKNLLIQQQNRTINQKLQDQLTQKNQFSQLIGRLKQELENETKKNQNMSAANQELKEQYTENNKQLSSLKDELRKLKKSHGDLTEQKKQFLRNINDLVNKQTDLHQQLFALNNQFLEEKRNFEQRIEGLQNNIQKLDLEIMEMIEENNLLKNEVSQIKFQNGILENQIKATKGELVEKNCRIENYLKCQGEEKRLFKEQCQLMVKQIIDCSSNAILQQRQQFNHKYHLFQSQIQFSQKINLATIESLEQKYTSFMSNAKQNHDREEATLKTQLVEMEEKILTQEITHKTILELETKLIRMKEQQISLLMQEIQNTDKRSDLCFEKLDNDKKQLLELSSSISSQLEQEVKEHNQIKMAYLTLFNSQNFTINCLQLQITELTKQLQVKDREKKSLILKCKEKSSKQQESIFNNVGQESQYVQKKEEMSEIVRSYQQMLKTNVLMLETTKSQLELKIKQIEEQNELRQQADALIIRLLEKELETKSTENKDLQNQVTSVKQMWKVDVDKFTSESQSMNQKVTKLQQQLQVLKSQKVDREEKKVKSNLQVMDNIIFKILKMENMDEIVTTFKKIDSLKTFNNLLNALENIAKKWEETSKELSEKNQIIKYNDEAIFGYLKKMAEMQNQKKKIEDGCQVLKKIEEMGNENLNVILFKKEQNSQSTAKFPQPDDQMSTSNESDRYKLPKGPSTTLEFSKFQSISRDIFLKTKIKNIETFERKQIVRDKEEQNSHERIHFLEEELEKLKKQLANAEQRMKKIVIQNQLLTLMRKEGSLSQSLEIDLMSQKEPSSYVIEDSLILKSGQLKVERGMKDSVNQSSIIEADPLFFLQSDILYEKQNYIEYLVLQIEKYIKKTLDSDRLIIKMTQNYIENEQISKRIGFQTLLFLFRTKEQVIAAISLRGNKQQIPVILMSLTNKEVAYPVSKHNKSISSENLYLVLGATQLRFIWKSRLLVTPKDPSKVSHFDRNIKNILGGEERIQIQQFQVFTLTFLS